MKRRLNVNSLVKVRLTTEGKYILRKKLDEVQKRAGNAVHFDLPHEDAEGYCTYQLWGLMQDFGGCIGLTSLMPFEAEIIIDDKELLP